jgi:hypothetical protein
MVKTILFVINHLGGNKEVERICQEQKIPFGGTLFSIADEIKPGVSYATSPVEIGFLNIISLIDKFNDIVILKDHKNYVIKLYQTELELFLKYQKEFLQSDKNVDNTFKILDQDKLNFFGCSHTVGVGHTSIETTYPCVLSNLMGIEYNNFGMGGKSNYNTEDLLSTFSIKNSKLIIQFTDIYRIRHLENDMIQDKSIYNIKDKLSNSLIFNEENLLFNFKNIVNRIVGRLRDGNNKFLITYTCNIENADAVKCHEFLYGFKEFSSTVGTQIDVAADGAHYGIQSHKLWAERLYKKWTELYGNK